jgi:hypothetical protein
MSQTFRILILLIISSVSLQAQTIKGKITNMKGDPIQYATVYIQELKLGTTSNTKGDYELRLPPGKYMVIYQSLGYEPIFANITISDKIINKDIVLPEQLYEIPEVRITASGEDPAYSIMRKAIGMAPYYLNNVSSYKAEVYLKGNLVIKRIPKIIQKSMKMDTRGNGATISAGGKPETKENIIKEGDSFLMESFNEMEFTAPDKYVQRVISFNSTFPSEGNEISPMDYIQASFYQPVIGDMAISPLSPAAFSHYKFKYLGSSLQGNYTINKIEVIPKRKSQQLFTGTIYIIEDLWCLNSVDLTNENLVGKIKIQQLYIPVQDEIWLPVSHKFEINISIVGFKADAGYGSSVKYMEVKPNLALKKPDGISTNIAGKPPITATGTDSVKPTKTKQQIDKILEKEELTNRDMVKLSRLMEKESERSLPDSSRNNLEIKDHTTHIIEKDANKKDSTYWAQIRPIPLSETELRSIRVSDSIKSVSSIQTNKIDTVTGKEVKKKSSFIKTTKNIFTGHTWSDTTGFRFTFGGLIELKNLSFNTVDGFKYGIDLSIQKDWKEGRSLYVSPEIYYAFSREQVLWKVNSYYRFGGEKQNQLYLRTGVISADFNNTGGINKFLNSVSSLFFRENYLKVYESRYFKTGYMTEIFNGLKIDISTTFENRHVLENNSDFAIISSNKEYSDNIPDNSYPESGANPAYNIQDMRHADLLTTLSYTPFRKYRIRNGRKIHEGSDWPTFSLTWQHGVNEFSEFDDKIKQFDMLRFETGKSKEIGAFSEFRWRIRTGGFLNNTYASFYDFYHVNSQSVPVLINNYEDVFMLPSYYSMSTPEFYGEVHVKYTTPYLLLKLMPGFSNTLMRENVSLSYFGSRYHKNYTELGYSISEIFLVGEVGIYVGFENLNYSSVGGKLVFKFN